MIYKSRSESSELQILTSLDARMTLPDADSQHLFNLRKGYEGEVLFDSLTKDLNCDCIIVNDLLLKLGSTTFQIDSLLIFSEIIHVVEIKNIEGDFLFERDTLYHCKTNKEYINPVNQLSRAQTLLRQLLKSIGFDLPMDGAVVFINPEFTLYQAPRDKRMIFPGQLDRYLKQLDSNPSKLQKKHKILADKLCSLHIENSEYKQIPTYEWADLQKGITCCSCKSLSVIVEGQKCVCLKCGHSVSIEAGIMREVKEMRLLFPDQKITTNGVHEWCGGMVSKKRIRRILKENYKKMGVNQWTYYE